MGINDKNLPAQTESQVPPLSVDPVATQGRAEIIGKLRHSLELGQSSVEIGGKAYKTEFVDVNGEHFQVQVQQFYDFMMRDGHIDPDEMADVPTFEHTMKIGDVAIKAIKEGNYAALTPKTQPYFIVNIRDPESNWIVAAMSGAMILGEITDKTPADKIPATFMLSYVAVDQSIRGNGAPEKIANQAFAHFQRHGIETQGILTEAVDSFEKGANKICGASRLYVKRAGGDGDDQYRQIMYVMPSQEYDVDGNPRTETIRSSSLMMSFFGADPAVGVQGRLVKDRLNRMWAKFYRRSADYYEMKHGQEGIPFDRARVDAAVVRNNAYIDGLLATMFAQFGDDEAVFPISKNERMQHLSPFVAEPLSFTNALAKESIAKRSYFIESLSKESLEDASTMADGVFSYVSGDKPSTHFKASLTEGVLQKEFPDIHSAEYWVVKGEDQKVVGVSGIYENLSDRDRVAWLGWMCVDPSARGQGVGRRLVEQAVTEAKARGKTALCLYTSDHPGEQNARKLYESLGFIVTKTDPPKRIGDGSMVSLVYMEKPL